MEPINLLIPVYNEEKILEKNVLKLMDFLNKNLNIPFKIFIVDGKSEDKTEIIGKNLGKKHEKVFYIKTDVKGKGVQLKKSTLSMDGKYFAFVDADLPTKLEEIKEIIGSLIKDEADLIIGSRNIGNKQICRPLVRKIASKTYNFLVRFFLGLPITDTQCGLKAWNSKVIGAWSKIQDRRWFFDTELLYYAKKQGNKIKEIPVSYFDVRKESKLWVLKDSFYFARALLRLKFRL